ncbi:MAG: hypothetical protein JSV38_09200 [Desulfobacterales bacterium]|nr:MAG: hypothetical protein JSV38_09200 [Desulfobacterales bacterium]
MKWSITAAEFEMSEPPLPLTPKDKADSFIGTVLSYGFGDDGYRNADSVLSA